jgi:hypothetical protein
MARKVPKTPEAKPLEEFMRFAKDFTNIYALVVKIAVCAPLIDLVLNVGPPWPSRLFVSTALVMEQVFVLMVSYSVWRQGKTSLSTVKAWLVSSFVGFSLLFLAAYIPLFAIYIEDFPDAKNRVVIGGTLQPSIQKFVEKEAVAGHAWGARKLLDHFLDGSHDMSIIWTSSSLAMARTLLLVVWITVCTVYGIGISAFLAIQYRRIS